LRSVASIASVLFTDIGTSLLLAVCSKTRTHVFRFFQQATDLTGIENKEILHSKEATMSRWTTRWSCYLLEAKSSAHMGRGSFKRLHDQSAFWTVSSETREVWDKAGRGKERIRKWKVDWSKSEGKMEQTGHNKWKFLIFHWKTAPVVFLQLYLSWKEREAVHKVCYNFVTAYELSVAE